MQPEALVLDKTEGNAPLTVAITAPAELLSIWKTWQKTHRTHSKWGDGFFIDWGDGSGEGDSSGRGPQDPPSTENETETHVFKTAGKYEITAGLYRFLPTDGHEYYWHGKASITVR